MRKEIFISQEIQDIVTVMTAPINITGIVEASGISTITTDSIRIFDNLCITMDLKDGMIVTMDDINYVVSNVTHTPSSDSFDVVATNLIATEWSVAVNFKPASRHEVLQMLNQEKGNLNRFPLMWLLPEVGLDKSGTVLDFEANITLVFAHKAEKATRTTDRIAGNFELVIHPLLTLFNLWLQSSDFNYMLEFNGHGKAIDYEQSNFAFYGTSDQSKEVLNTTTDAIEVNYDLKFKKQFIN